MAATTLMSMPLAKKPETLCGIEPGCPLDELDEPSVPVAHDAADVVVVARGVHVHLQHQPARVIGEHVHVGVPHGLERLLAGLTDCGLAHGLERLAQARLARSP